MAPNALTFQVLTQTEPKRRAANARSSGVQAANVREPAKKDVDAFIKRRKERKEQREKAKQEAPPAGVAADDADLAEWRASLVDLTEFHGMALDGSIVELDGDYSPVPELLNYRTSLRARGHPPCLRCSRKVFSLTCWCTGVSRKYILCIFHIHAHACRVHMHAHDSC